MPFKFENLHVWQRALDLSDKISSLVRQFPKFELFNLNNQFRRAADSVVLNIAEGSTGQTNAEYRKFLNYSIRSSAEVVGCLFLAKKKAYITEIQFNYFYEQYEILIKMITKLRDNLDP
jgi:four helix bundle protein